MRCSPSGLSDHFIASGTFPLPRGPHALRERKEKTLRTGKGVRSLAISLFCPDLTRSWCDSGCRDRCAEPSRTDHDKVRTLLPLVSSRGEAAIEVFKEAIKELNSDLYQRLEHTEGESETSEKSLYEPDLDSEESRYGGIGSLSPGNSGTLTEREDAAALPKARKRAGTDDTFLQSSKVPKPCHPSNESQSEISSGIGGTSPSSSNGYQSVEEAGLSQDRDDISPEAITERALQKKIEELEKKAVDLKKQGLTNEAAKTHLEIYQHIVRLDREREGELGFRLSLLSKGIVQEDLQKRFEEGEVQEVVQEIIEKIAKKNFDMLNIETDVKVSDGSEEISSADQKCSKGRTGTIKVHAKSFKLREDYVLEKGKQGAVDHLFDHLVDNPDELRPIRSYLNAFDVQVSETTHRTEEAPPDELIVASQPAVYPLTGAQTTSYTAISRPTSATLQIDSVHTGTPESKKIQEDHPATTKAASTSGLDRATSVDNLVAPPSPIKPVEHSNLRGLFLAMGGGKDLSCADADDGSRLHFTVREVQTALQIKSKKAQQQQKDVLKAARDGTDDIIHCLRKEITRLTQKDEKAQKILLDHKLENQQLKETNKTKEDEIEKLTAENTKLSNQLPDLHDQVKSLTEKDKTSQMALSEKTQEIQQLQKTNDDLAAKLSNCCGGVLRKEKRGSETEKRQSGSEDASEASVKDMSDTAVATPMESDEDDSQPMRAELSLRNKLYMKISQNLSEDEVKSLRQLMITDKYIGRDIAEDANPHDIFKRLEADSRIGVGNLGLLKDVFIALGKEKLAEEAEAVEKEEGRRVFNVSKRTASEDMLVQAAGNSKQLKVGSEDEGSDHSDSYAESGMGCSASDSLPEELDTELETKDSDSEKQRTGELKVDIALHHPVARKEFRQGCETGAVSQKIQMEVKKIIQSTSDDKVNVKPVVRVDFSSPESAVRLREEYDGQRLHAQFQRLISGLTISTEFDIKSMSLAVQLTFAHEDETEKASPEQSGAIPPTSGQSSTCTVQHTSATNPPTEDIYTAEQSTVRPSRFRNSRILVESLTDSKTTIEMLLGKGADVNMADKDGRTPLWIAAQKGQLPTSEILLSKGADVNMADKDCRTPLWIAAQEG
ncbi:hypothetical protein Bbelb_153820 [Branchiostoma belcheri]|nr:hypothetical protein Bbelb_153820 [Branchiostoma belcheri]